MSRFNLLTVLMSVTLFCTIAAGAGAQDYLWGYPGANWGYASIYATESAPYFALHPPVYYSLPVPRTYGYGPFPYPPGVLTPGSEPVRARAMRYACQTGEEDSGVGETAPMPLRIQNPFVEQSGKSAMSTRSKGGRIARQVVYPILLADMPKKSH
jgi:hypothetical protein